MLQSPKNRVQRQQRLNTACENPLIEAKHHVLSSTDAQKRTLQRQQHRRQLSVPDDAFLMRSGMSSKVLDPFDMNGNGMNQESNMMNGSYNIFTVTEQSPMSNPAQQGQDTVIVVIDGGWTRCLG